MTDRKPGRWRLIFWGGWAGSIAGAGIGGGALDWFTRGRFSVSGVDPASAVHAVSGSAELAVMGAFIGFAIGIVGAGAVLAILALEDRIARLQDDRDTEAP